MKNILFLFLLFGGVAYGQTTVIQQPCPTNGGGTTLIDYSYVSGGGTTVVGGRSCSGWYGIKIIETQSSPDVIRIASDMKLHAELPVHKLLKGCLLNDNGTVNYYLKADDWTKKEDGTASKRDGTDGQVMIEWPDFYYLVENPSISVYTIKISINPLPGFSNVPKHYVSAYQAALNRTTNKLSSVANLSTTYRGGSNTSAWDTAYNSQLGMPATNYNRTNGRIYARNRGTGWNLYSYEDHKWLFWFFAIEYATLNSQKPVNATLTSNGYKQGGLGNGVSTVNSTDWSTRFSYNPFVKCGQSDAIGNGTGESAYTVRTWNVTVNVPRYRGHENPFGHIWQIVDGINIDVQSVASGNLSVLYTSDNQAYWQDNNYTNYILKGNINRSDGYISKLLMGSKAEILPISATGTSTTYYCDYYYTSIPASGTSLRMLIVGGNAYGATAGFVFSSTSYAPSSAHAFIGSRLRFMAL